MKVSDIMTPNVAYVDANSSVTEAAQLMQKNNIGSVPVCESNKVVGIITDRDIVVRNVAHGTDPKNTPVRNVMTTGVTTVTPDTDVSQITELMSQSQIRRVPVVDKDKLVGVVALGDLATDRRFDTEASEALTDISKPNKHY